MLQPEANVVRDRSPRREAIAKFQTDTRGRHTTPRLLSALCPACFFWGFFFFYVASFNSGSHPNHRAKLYE